MNEAILIWLYLTGGKIIVFYWVAASLLSILAFVSWISASSDIQIYADSYKYDWGKKKVDSANKTLDFIKNRFPYKTLVLIGVLTLFYPTQNDLKYIIGGAVVWNGIEAAADIEGIERLPENLVNAANSFLENVSEKKAD